MNNDIEMITEDWLEEMLGTCQRRGGRCRGSEAVLSG